MILWNSIEFETNELYEVYIEVFKTSFYLAAENENIEIIELLLTNEKLYINADKVFNILSTTFNMNFNKKSALKNALATNNIEEVKKLILENEKFDSHAIKKRGRPPKRKNESNEYENQDPKPKRKVGRPPKPKNDNENSCKDYKVKKKTTNETRMEQLENPKLMSVSNQHKYAIELPINEPMNNKDVIAFYESTINDRINWESIDPEQMFAFGTNINDHNLEMQDNEMKDDEIEDIEVQKNEMNDDEYSSEEYSSEEYSSEDYSSEEYSDDDEDLNNDVTIENLESFAPFKDPSEAYTFISRANKMHRIIEVPSKDPNSLLFRCAGNKCFYQVVCSYKNDGYHITSQSCHTCLSMADGKQTFTKQDLYDAAFTLGEQEHITNSYKNQICDLLGVPRGSIYHQRIERAHNKVFNKNKVQRLKTWGMLESFIAIIKAHGGNGEIHKNDQGKIDFVGFIPDYAIKFFHSSLFFGVVQLDTRFQNGISKGRLYLMIALTGDRTILPVGAAWAPSEAIIYTDMFLSMFKNETELIKSCLTDEADALITSIEKIGIKNFLCAWHMELHCKNKSAFKSLVSCSNSHDYSIFKHKIITECSDLKEHLDKNNRWEKITRFESSYPRDQNLATAGVESLNSIIARYHFKKKEPLDVFLFIYEFGYLALQKICSQTLFFTDAVSSWLSYALHVAHNLDVSKTILKWGLYDVTKGKNLETACSVMIIPNQKPSCSCKFYNDSGMPCVHLLAVACKYNMDWCSWVHPRYFTSEYKALFQNNLNYPDFKQIIQTNNDQPVNKGSLKQKTTRIKTPGEVKKSHQSKKHFKH